jgi:hypothetical protein
MSIPFASYFEAILANEDNASLASFHRAPAIDVESYTKMTVSNFRNISKASSTGRLLPNSDPNAGPSLGGDEPFGVSSNETEYGNTELELEAVGGETGNASTTSLYGGGGTAADEFDSVLRCAPMGRVRILPSLRRDSLALASSDLECLEEELELPMDGCC